MTEWCIECKGIIGICGVGTYFCNCKESKPGATYLEHLGVLPDITLREFITKKEKV